jgi:hypothetical protein
MYATNTYCMLQKDCTGNALVLLVYILLVCKLANAAKQNMLWAEHSSSMGWRQSTLVQAWRMAGCFVRVVWIPWQCHPMWPLSGAVDGGRWCMIRWVVRPRIVVSSELCARAWRSVGIGGKQNTWWIKCAWLPAMEGAATLATMAIRGTAVVGMVIDGRLGTRGIIHNPVRMHLLPHRIVWPRCVMLHPILAKRTLHPALQSVTTLTSESDANPGKMWSRHAAAGSLGKFNVHVCVDHTWSLLGRHAMMGLLASCTLVTGAPVVRKLLVATEFKNTHLLMVSMSMLTVRRSASVASAYWVGIGQECNRLWVNLILLSSSAPACQKLLYQP